MSRRRGPEKAAGVAQQSVYASHVVPPFIRR
jgi:hypothetical protein